MTNAYEKLMADPVLAELSGALIEAGHSAWLVGGRVRDALLGREGPEADVVVEGAATFARAFADRVGGRYVLLHEAPETARVALVGRHPRVKHYVIDFCGPRAETIEGDLRARDFTVNAMAVELSPDPSPRIIDPLDGQLDLSARLLRMAGPDALQVDPLRILRAYRLASEAELHIGPVTREAMRAHAHLVTEPAGERIREELLTILGHRTAALRCHQMAEDGVLGRLLPPCQAAPDEAVGRLARLAGLLEDISGLGPMAANILREQLMQSGSLASTRLSVLMGLCSEEDLLGVAERLRLSRQGRHALVQVRRLIGDLREGRLRLDERGAAAAWVEHGFDALACALVDHACGPDGPGRQLATELVTSVLPRAGIPQMLDTAEVRGITGAHGAALGEHLRALRMAQITGDVTGPQEAREFLQGRSQ